VYVVPSDITWFVTEDAHAAVSDIRTELGEQEYNQDVRDLRELLCGYFCSVIGCTKKQGRTISPVGVVKHGGKVLKVRWMRPGCGKSGGLRLGFVAFCDQRKVVLVHASLRRDSDDDELMDAAEEAEDYVSADFDDSSG
jgi:hypothetical protein